MKLYMMIIDHYPAIVISNTKPSTRVNHVFVNNKKALCFGIERLFSREIFDYLCKNYNIPSSKDGFIEVDL